VRLGNERAIGTWVDPNAYAGFLLMVGGLVGAQLFSPRPVTGPRWLAFACFGAVGLALFLSDSRGAMLGLGAGLGVVALLRYRRLLWLGALAVGLILLLPVTQGYVAKFVAGLTAADLETQMRLGEYQDALRLIAEYPVFGVGFTSVPTIDLYVGFSNTYLTLAAYAGLVGLAAYLLAVGGALVWGLGRWYSLRERADLADVWLGLLAGVVGALIGGLFDHFYFNPRYQATSLMFWALVGLLMAATRLSQPAKTGEEGGQASIYLPPRG
jgi:O-antigen ligase